MRAVGVTSGHATLRLDLKRRNMSNVRWLFRLRFLAVYDFVADVVGRLEKELGGQLLALRSGWSIRFNASDIFNLFSGPIGSVAVGHTALRIFEGQLARLNRGKGTEPLNLWW